MTTDADVTLVLAAYAAYARGDIDAAVRDVHPDVVWIEPDEFPNGGTRHGPAAVAAYLQASYDSWQSFVSEPTPYVYPDHPYPDRVVIVHHVTGVLKDGTPKEATVADVFTVHDGRITHMSAYADPSAVFS